MNEKKYLIGAGQDISELKKVQHKLSRSLEEKSVLLSEIHHRVKNNLAIISGILQLEAFQVKDPEGQEILTNTTSRIRSIANIHELMYEQKDLSRVAFHKVIAAIANDFSISGNVTINCSTEEVVLNVNQAVPCGLVINELLSITCENFQSDDSKGEVDIDLKVTDGKIGLKIVGINTGHNSSEEKHRIEFTFINRFIEQLDANFKINRNGNLEYNIQFEKKEMGEASSSWNFN